MSAAPKIDCSSISVFGDKLGVDKVNRGEAGVVGGREDKRRANSEEGNTKSPNIFKCIFDIKDRFCTNDRAIGKGTTIKRNDKFRNSTFNNFPNASR